MKTRIDNIIEILSDKKAENIEIIDMRDSDYFTNFVILADTLAQKHAMSLIDDLKTKLKPKGENFLAIDSSDEWSVIDLGDILIHLLSKEYRQKYNIEELLGELNKKK